MPNINIRRRICLTFTDANRITPGGLILITENNLVLITEAGEILITE